MNSTTLPPPGANPNNTGLGLRKYENWYQLPAFSLLALRRSESFPPWAFGKGPGHTNPGHIWKRGKQCFHKYSDGGNGLLVV